MAKYLVTEPEILKVVSMTLNTLGVPELAMKINIYWNDRFIAKLGQACSRFSKNVVTQELTFIEAEVELSVKLFALAKKIDQTETIIHEVCHVVASYLHKRSMGHRREWKNLMKLCGYGNARRCLHVDRSNMLARKRKPHVKMKCKCPGGVLLGPTRAKRILSGEKNYICLKCRASIRPN